MVDKDPDSGLEHSAPNSNSVQREKSAFDELLDQLIKLQAKKRFQNFDIIKNTIHCEFHPNEMVMVSINIWNAMELWIRIIFEETQEMVEIEDTSFGKYSVELKVKRLQNLIMNFKRVPKRKEDLLPKIHDWNNFLKCNYYYRNFQNFKVR